MKNMFKVDYQGATLIEKNFIKQMLRMASGDVLDCVQSQRSRSYPRTFGR